VVKELRELTQHTEATMSEYRGKSATARNRVNTAIGLAADAALLVGLLAPTPTVRLLGMALFATLLGTLLVRRWPRKQPRSWG
jgi:hypothetical protein